MALLTVTPDDGVQAVFPPQKLNCLILGYFDPTNAFFGNKN